MENSQKYLYLDLVKYISLYNPIFNNYKFLTLSQTKNKDIILNFFINIKKLEEYLKINNLQTIKILYFNIFSINSILYDYEKTITLNTNGKINNLSFYFYANLLIKNNPHIVNYLYSQEFIKELNEQGKNNNKDLYKKIIISKIILELIDNYEQYTDNNYDEIEKIKTENKNIINRNNIFHNLNLNIDEIYGEIIISLIKDGKLEDYDYAYDIINQLDLQSIDITQCIFKKIKEELLLNNNRYISKYLISKKEDLFNDKIINFYYILIKFILKDSIFIYQIDLLYKLRKYIIKLIKSEILLSSKIENMNNNNKERLEYIIKEIVDLEYYKNKFFKYKNSTLKLIEESKSLGSNGDNIIINNLDDISENSENLNNIIDNNSLPNNNFNSQKILERNSFIDHSNLGIISEDTNTQKLIQKTSNNYNISYSQLSKYSIKENTNSSNAFIVKASSTTSNPNYRIKNDNENNTIYRAYRIIEYRNIIGNHKKEKRDNKAIYTSDLIYETNEGFISGGTNNKIRIYNKLYQKVMKKKDIPYFPLSFCEIIYLKKTYIFIPNIDYLYCYHFSLEDRKMAFKEKVHFPNVEILFLLKEKNNNIFICCKDQIIYKQNVFIKITKKEYKNFPIKNVKSGIKINNNFIAFKSCNIKNSFIKFYNCNSQKLINKEIKGYSFIYSTNGLAIMPREETNSNNKILLCACKKYLKNQKNGILL